MVLRGAMPIADGLDSVFDTIGGLPVHPLIAHFAVVILPLAATGLLPVLVMRAARKRFGLLVLAGLLGGTGAAFIAEQAGEALAARVGLPQNHANLGELLPPLGFALFAVAAVWYVLVERAESGTASGLLAHKVVHYSIGSVAAALAVGALAMTTLVGHSGAEAVWKNRISPQPEPSASATPTTDPYAWTLEDVVLHSSTSDCWTILGSKVYDLTPYLAANPSDSSVRCGTISTSLKVPSADLPNYEVGTYASPTDAPGFTAAEVAQHSTGNDCWSIVNGKVYELTAWIPLHPGGQQVIEAMCGKDASAGFNGQHAGAQNPNDTLAGYEIGVLK